MNSLTLQLQELVDKYGYLAVIAALGSAGECKCGKCGHSWRPRIAGTPTQCPRCKSIKWAEV